MTSLIKIQHIHTASTGGGATSVALSLVEAQRTLGYDVNMLAGYGQSADTKGVQAFESSRRLNAFDAALFRMTEKEGALTSVAWLANKNKPGADLVHLHNAHGYYLPKWMLWRMLARPCIWTLHDFWAITGRCAMPMACEGYLSGCSSCPHKEYYPATWNDRARYEFPRRRALLEEAPATLVVPTECARNVFYQAGVKKDIAVIANPVEMAPVVTDAGLKHRRESAKIDLGLSSSHFLILFIARKLADSRKGLADLCNALKEQPNNSHALLIAIGETGEESMSLLNSLPITIQTPGLLDRKLLCKYLLAADLVLAPYTMETFGLVYIEALTSGAALIAYDIPVAKEVLEMPTRFDDAVKLVPAEDISLLRRAVEKSVNNPAYPSDQYRRSLHTAYDPESVALQYINLYKDILAHAET